MRWLKHMTCANRDEKMMRIMDEFGVAGYGMYWLILETIAEKLDESNDTFIEMSVQSWRKLTGIPPKTLEKFLSFCQVLGLFVVKNSENLISVDCPNLLKYRDEYQRKQSKKSGQAPDKLQPKNTDTDTDTDTEEKKKPPISPFDVSSMPLPEKIDRGDWTKWLSHFRESTGRYPSEEQANQQIRDILYFARDGTTTADVICYNIGGGYKRIYNPAKQESGQKSASKKGDISEGARSFLNAKTA